MLSGDGGRQPGLDPAGDIGNDIGPNIGTDPSIRGNAIGLYPRHTDAQGNLVGNTEIRPNVVLEPPILVQALADRCLAAFQRSERHYVSDVLVCPDNETAADLAGRISSNTNFTSRELCMVSLHGDHVHIIHDCAYSNRSCRCSFFETFEIRKYLVKPQHKYVRSRVKLPELKRTDWIDIILYFCTRGHRMVIFVLRGVVVKIQTEMDALEIGGFGGGRPKRSLETCLQGGGVELLGDVEGLQVDRACRRAGPSPHQHKESRSQGLQAKIEAMIFRFPTCPIKGIVTHPKWLADPELKYIAEGDKDFDKVVASVAHRLCSWSIYEFQELYNTEGVFPRFMSGYMDINDKYFNVEESVLVLDELLKNQVGSENDRRAFLIDLFNILERKYAKKNTILVHSPPNGGKNFFFDVYLNYYLNRGQFHSVANKTNHFAFQEAYAKRILLWNEPNYEGCLTDLLKEITGGDDFTVAVKNRGDAAVYKTPLIILTNNRIDLMNNPAFRERVSVYYWTSCPWLAMYTKKPNPLAAFALFEKYGIVLQ
uniref:Nonstructural protein n=1 Tax=Phoenicurus auroreus ambidensovirus TaxID=2794456 RepID=A0A8A4XCF7_9VIRU|nr:MAG: nonstructural protein [Phoenicurus auroreus ambidensovirus]